MIPVVETQNIRIGLFGGKKLIEGASFSINAKESIAIMGPSGSGKTTLALSLLDLQPRKIEVEGNVYFFQKNLNLLKQNEKRKLLGSEISILLQDPSSSLNPFFTLGFHFQELLKKNKRLCKSSKKEKILRALLDVGLKNTDFFLKAYPHQLSGGEKQRALIAMALLNDPKLFIADEPTASLDLVVKVEILKLIQSLQKEKGFAFILITHDPLIAVKMCSRVYEIKDRKLILKK